MADHRKSAQHDRLKQALRENLKRRKAQAKGQAERQARRSAERAAGDDRDQHDSIEHDETDSESGA